LVVGTRNRKKREELLEILGGDGLELLDLTSFPDAPEVVEDGATFEANARKKATELAKHLGRWVLGEDSGLVVPALNGRPGVYSARYAGEHGNDEANNDRLLAELAPMAADKRGAYYVCTAALADPTGDVKAVAEGRCHGVIIDRRRGAGGFGYDPIFIPAGERRTVAELGDAWKRRNSHRARAALALAAALAG
jgi:XTP/dITP diphosphohydrolase